MKFFALSVLMCELMVSGLQAAPQAKEWTIMVFLNADNNLDSYGVDDLNEMQTVGSNDKFNIIVEIDREEGPAKRVYVKKGSSDVIKEMGEVDMGDYKHLVDFVKWGATSYPAKKYLVVLWNHGSGWNKKAGNVFKGISYDDSSGNHITTNQLTTATAEIKSILGKKLDILAYDACLMGMPEVHWAVKENVDISVASEETEPGDGWPYDDILKPFAAKPTMAPAELADIIVKKYVASYSGGSAGRSDCTQSAVDNAKLPAMVEKLNAWCEAAMGQHTAEINTVLTKVQKFYYRSNIDLIHFMQLYKDAVGAKDELLAGKTDEVIAAARAAMVSNANYGYKMKDAQGMAIYLPQQSYSWAAQYASLAWAKDTKWDEFAKAFYGQARILATVEAAQKGDLTPLRDLISFDTGMKQALKEAFNNEILINRTIGDEKVIVEINNILK